MAAVLIVDDRPINRQYLATLLGYGRHTILEANNGREALDIARATRPDLVITDVMMPVMDGYELVQRLQADPGLAKIPVIFYTATYRIPEARMLAKGCGAAAVLPKPCEPQEILRVVNDALGIPEEDLSSPPPPEAAPPPAVDVGANLNLIGDSVSDVLHELQSLRTLMDSVVERGARLAGEREKLREIARRYAENAAQLQHVSGRLSVLLEMGLDLVQQTDPRVILQMLFDTASRIVPSNCINLMVMDSRAPERRWMRCRGVSDEQQAEMMQCEAMPGLPGRVLAEHRTLRVSAGDGSALPAAEFPPSHPPVGSFLGVPIIGRVDHYGAIFFANPPGAPAFTEEDERVAQTLAAAGAITYENALMYEELQQHAVKLRLEVAERERAERELLKFRAAVDQSTDGIFLIDPATSRILDSNRTAYEKLGYSREELLTCGVTDFEVELPEHFQWDEHVREVRAAGRLTFNGCHRRKDGSTYPVEVSIRYIAAASGDLMIAVVRDVTERRERERTILHLSRMHAVLSGINTLIVRERSREVLFREACRIAVDVGGFKLAWIGLIENDVLRPVAMQGDDGGHLAQLRINITSAEPGECEPTTLAMRDGQPHGSQDVAGDPGLADWRETLLALGIRSFVALPLKVAGRLAGCINLYAGDAGFFDEAEMTLLAELAGDIAYAMEFIVQKEESDYLAYYDPLTGLANRRLFLERVEEYLDAARRIKRLVAVGLLNLDNFRSINSSLGQAAGDELLKAVAGRLTRVAGSPNFLARIVADQYAVVMPNLEDVTDLAQVLKDSLIKRLSRPVPIESQEVRISGKGGFAVFPGDGEDAETLLRNAESALKNAKRSGESVVFYTERMGKALSERLGLENQMRRAFEQHEFVLHYQPKVDLRSGGICGAEALIRWNSPELGLVPPVKFIPLLEDTGMIVEVGRWALQQAVEDRRRWQASGLSAPRIAVNVSPLQMKQPDFVEVVCASVVTSAERAPGIDLEVTESMLMGDIETAIARLGALREKGINTAIDDFGTGYSSLAYLARLPVAAVKIDRSFVIKMAENADTMAIVSTIITLAHSMNLKVVAEGVDSPEQLKFLRLLKCDEIQGYLFSKPLPADEFAALLKEGRRLA